MDLEAIPGVGEKTAAALRELDDPDAALERGDVATLASAPGVSTGKAARIARAAIRRRHGESGDFLATDRARELHREVLARLEERAVTAYGKRRIETFYPSTADSRIEEVRAFVTEAMERDPVAAVGDALADVEPLQEPPDRRIHDRCLATTDAETYSAAREAIPEVSVEIVEDARDLADLARGYSTVIALDGAFAGVEVEGDVRVEPDALERPEEVVPERVLGFFAENRDRLRAAIDVHRAAGMDAPGDVDALEAALDRLDGDGEVAGDDELDRLERAADDVDAVAASAADAATERLREAIRERDVTIEGADLLSLAEQGAGVGSILESELDDAFEAAIRDARERIVETLDLSDHEAERARRALPDRPTYPVAYDEDVIARLGEELRKARDRRAGKLKRGLAADLAEVRENAEKLVREALERDVERAVARFVRDFDCTLPELGGEGFSIEGGRCFLLEEPFGEIEPVDYGVEGVVVLSGVNSGGKTSTLDLIGTVAVLAHMGLPVPAERARVERLDSLHYFTKSSGTLDAGAFEATVQEFGDLVSGRGDRLVLVDELESITEPGASARIIAGILETLAEEGATAVFVSHLAEEVREAADCALTVDGIEAEGLIDGELRINRSPVKGHLARSMPELIVEKLVGQEDADFYRRLLGKFEDR
jgi:dsDNA-specific endonuclease/ATPase MutS2